MHERELVASGDLSGPLNFATLERGQIDLMRNSRSCIGRNHWDMYRRSRTTGIHGTNPRISDSMNGISDSEWIRVIVTVHVL